MAQQPGLSTLMGIVMVHLTTQLQQEHPCILVVLLIQVLKIISMDILAIFVM